jgi:peptide/nickel transport system permease protein
MTMGIYVYLLKRVLMIIPLILVVLVVNFTLVHLAPGNPAYYLAGDAATPEYISEMTERLGLNKPLHEQLLIYLRSCLSGDLGSSAIYNQPVLSLIFSRIPATLLLMLTSYIFSLALGVFVGAAAAKKRHSRFDNALSILSLTGYSMPVFWLGILSILVFSLYLKILPAQGMYNAGSGLTGIGYAIDVLYHLILPATVLGVYNFATIIRLTRGSVLEQLSQDYITTARSKGLNENQVLYKHALRNALLPVTTIAGIRFGKMFAGAVMTEIVFAWPGLGRLAYDALLMRDYPLIMGMFVIIALLVGVSSFVTDIVYAYLDPRIRYGKA